MMRVEHTTQIIKIKFSSSSGSVNSTQYKAIGTIEIRVQKNNQLE